MSTGRLTLPRVVGDVIPLDDVNEGVAPRRPRRHRRLADRRRRPLLMARRWLITGASRGIGAAIAAEAVARGDSALLVARGEAVHGRRAARGARRAARPLRPRRAGGRGRRGARAARRDRRPRQQRRDPPRRPDREAARRRLRGGRGVQPDRPVPALPRGREGDGGRRGDRQHRRRRRLPRLPGRRALRLGQGRPRRAHAVLAIELARRRITVQPRRARASPRRR